MLAGFIAFMSIYPEVANNVVPLHDAHFWKNSEKYFLLSQTHGKVVETVIVSICAGGGVTEGG
jgi:hypothetical protein